MEEGKDGEESSVVDMEAARIDDPNTDSAVADPTETMQNDEAEAEEVTVEQKDSDATVALPSENVRAEGDGEASGDELKKEAEEKLDSNENKESDDPTAQDESYLDVEPQSSTAVDQQGQGNPDSPASEKYESAQEDMESGGANDDPGKDKDPSAEMEAADVSNLSHSLNEDSVKESQHRSAVELDENSNSSSHLQDIEMTDVDENRVKNEDTMEDDNNRSMYNSTVEDPFDQLKHSTNDGDGPEETRETESDNGEKKDAGEDSEGGNHEEGATAKDSLQAEETEQEHIPESAEAEASARDDGAASAEVDSTESRTVQAEEEEKSEDHDREDNLNQEATEAPASDDAEREEQVASEEPTETSEQPLEEESGGPVDDLTGGENENVCLLPDDERAIPEEDKERAIAEEEATKEAERQESEARANEAEAGDEDATAEENGDGRSGSTGEKGQSKEGEEGMEVDVQTETTDTVEVPDDEVVAEEMEVDGPAGGGVADNPPPRANQIRELLTLAASETCAHCKKEATECAYSMQREEGTAAEGATQQFICSFDCVQSIRKEFPGKFELIQQRVTIFPIYDYSQTCVRCGVYKVCKYRYRQEENIHKYVCEMECVRHFTSTNGEKYTFKTRRYDIEEKAPPLKDDLLCVQCGNTKACAFGFTQDVETQHVCSDCLNLFMTEHPDLFRLNRRRTVRVRNLLPKATQSSTNNASADSGAGDIVKFTARSDEEAEAARVDREASFQQLCFVCKQCLMPSSDQCLQWETMNFCGINCLRNEQNRIGQVCIHCQQAVSLQSLGKYCVRFGFSVCQFCSAGCLDNYKKKLISCSYCQKDVSKNDKRYVARVGDLGVFKDFCSQICHKRYQTSLNPVLKHKHHVCAVCNHEKLSKIIVHLEGREQYFCSTPCFSAFKFVNNVIPDKCGMCRDYFERKSAESYTIFSQSGSPPEVTTEGIPFCTKMCLNLYIISHRQIVACHWCKVKKYNFDMIQRAFGKILLCSLHCLALAEASVAAKTMQELRCDHCLFVRTPQYHLTMSDASLRNFCTYQCVMSFQSQFSKPPLTVQTSEQQQESNTTAPVPTGLPKRIRKIISIPMKPSSAVPSATTSNAAPIAVGTKLILPPPSLPAITPPSTRARERSTRSTVTLAVAAPAKTSVGTTLPVISAVHSLAAVGSRVTRTKVSIPPALNQGKWPELRVTLEPLKNIPPSGTIPLSSIVSASNSNTVRIEPPPPVEPTVSPSPPPSPPPPSPPPSPSPPTPPPVVAPPIVETHTQIVTIPPTPVQVANASTMCKPLQVTRSVSCRPIQCSVECQTEDWLQRKIVIPIPVPIYVPVPMFMYSMPTPVPVPIPLPIPVPVFIPTTRNSAAGIMKEIKKIQDKMPTDPYEAELLMMAEMVAGDKKKDDSDSDSDDAGGDDQYGASGGSTGGNEMEHNTSFSEDLVQMALKMASNDYEETQVDLESAMQANTISQQQQEQQHGYTDLQQHHHQQQQQLLMMEQQRQQDSPGLVQRGRKRGQPGAAGPRAALANNNTQQLTTPATKRIKREQHSEPSPEPVRVVEPVEKPDANMCLKYTFGVNAWKQWVLTKNADLEKSTIRRKPFKSDILQLTADELNFSLCLFVKEVRKPNGTEYAPDTIYYLVLGIQQYLFENGRVENIFTDPYYERFTDCLDEVAKKFSVLYNDSQFIVTRVEEEHLWECKQLGAHSPHVLLSTLMFFNTKHFNLVSVEEHMELSFSHIMKHWKRNPQQGAKAAASRNVLLRFYPPQSSLAANSRKKKVYEQQENEENPLRCPVKLYEFYLSKCPESVKTRNDVFYLQPERSCVPDSPVWYSTQPLSKESLSKMLHRVKMVKEINIALLTS